jgi:hypothetical protein
MTHHALHASVACIYFNPKLSGFTEAGSCSPTTLTVLRRSDSGQVSLKVCHTGYKTRRLVMLLATARRLMY